MPMMSGMMLQTALQDALNALRAAVSLRSVMLVVSVSLSGGAVCNAVEVHCLLLSAAGGGPCRSGAQMRLVCWLLA